MITRTAYKSRHYTDADLEAVCDLLNACDAVDKMDDSYTVEDLRLEFESPNLSKERDIRLWEDETGRLAAFAQTWIPKEMANDGDPLEVSCYLRVHPEARDRGIEAEMIGWAAERTSQAAAAKGLPGRMRVFNRDTNTYAHNIYEQHGFRPVRYFFTMYRPLNEPIEEAVLPEGYTLDHVSGEADMEKWVDAFNNSFIDHWGFRPMRLEDHKHWLSSPKYKPERDLVAIAPDGTYAAFCFCWIDPDDNERNNRNEGWIDMLGTRRGHRKLGLGRAMLLAGLHKLKEEGLDTGVLGVDAENPTGALRLYESVGFLTRSTSLAYHRDL